MDVTDAIRTRWACRAFLDTPIPDVTIRHILSLASWAPSGVNSQPWQVSVVKGKTKQAITDTLVKLRDDDVPFEPDYAYYPDQWTDPYRARRIDCGKTLYEALGIKREDKDRQKIAWQNNYRFFGAPVGLFFFLDQHMNKGSWVDMGMFIQTAMLAAQDSGLATCPQAALADYPNHVREILGIDKSLSLVCGMAIGYADTYAPVNQYRLKREPVENFSSWYD